MKFRSSLKTHQNERNRYILVIVSVGKESTCNAGDLSLIPGLGRSPEGGHGNPLQYSCLGNPMNRGVWWAAVHGVAKSQMGLKQLSTHPEYFHNVTDTYFT